MKDTYTMIKSRAKARLSQNFGDAFLIILIPLILMMVVNAITGRIFTVDPDNMFTVNYFIVQIISIVLSVYMSYAIIRQLLPYSRGKQGIDFNGFFQFDNRFVQFFFYQSIVSIIQFALNLPGSQKMLEVSDQFGRLAETPEELLAYLETPEFQEFLTMMAISWLLILLFWVILIRLRMVPYLIIDQDKTAMEAVAMSWNITRGNFFRILFFPFSFIGWILLVIITCGLGIVYVAPLMAVSYTYLYMAIMRENGTPVDENFNTQPEESTPDPLDAFYD